MQTGNHIDRVLSGVFVDNAMNLIPIPSWSEKQITEFFDMTMKQALSFGLTSIHDADTKPAHIAFFQKLADAGKLPVRLTLLSCTPMKAKPYAAEQALPHGQQRLGRILGRHAPAAHRLRKARAPESAQREAHRRWSVSFELRSKRNVPITSHARCPWLVGRRASRAVL